MNSNVEFPTWLTFLNLSKRNFGSFFVHSTYEIFAREKIIKISGGHQRTSKLRFSHATYVANDNGH